MDMNNKETTSDIMVDHQNNYHKEQQHLPPLKKRFCLRQAAPSKPNTGMDHSYTIDSIPIFRQLSKHDIHRMNSAVSTTSVDMSGALDLLSFANAKGEEGDGPSSELSLCSSSSSSNESDDQEQFENVGNGERIYRLEEKDVLCMIAQPDQFTADETVKLAKDLNNYFMSKDIVVLEDHPKILEKVKKVNVTTPFLGTT